MILAILKACIIRDLSKALKQKTRLLGTMARPLLWLLVIGQGLDTVVTQVSEYRYQGYLLPGLVGMVLLFGGVLCALSIASEKESGVIRLYLMAPFSRSWIVFARTVSAAIVAIFYVSFFILLVYPFDFFPHQVQWTLLGTAILTSALLWASFGMLLAVFSKSMENFSLIVNLIIFPLYFFSGALYPLKGLPSTLHHITLLNPFSYCVDLLQHAMNMTEVTHYSVKLDLFVIIVFTLILTSVSCIVFNHKSFDE
jgi:ABC-2 type transport system permease protein